MQSTCCWPVMCWSRKNSTRCCASASSISVMSASSRRRVPQVDARHLRTDRRRERPHLHLRRGRHARSLAAASGSRRARWRPAPQRASRCCGGRDRRRSGDPTLFRRVLCRLSYPAGCGRAGAPSAVLTGFEPAASALTGRRALQTAPQDQVAPPGFAPDELTCPQGSSNPRYRLERAASWATRRWGLGSPEAGHRSSRVVGAFEPIAMRQRARLRHARVTADDVAPRPRRFGTLTIW